MALSAQQALDGRYEVQVGGCWTWTRGRTTAGYPEACVEGRVVYAHRVMYELAFGPIPTAHDVHHVCENRACVNPDHLEAISHADHAGGVGHGKLTRMDAEDIRRLKDLGVHRKLIAARYGITANYVNEICRRKTWG